MIKVGRVARLLVALFVVVLCGSAHGQEASEEDLQAMKQANNPLADFRAFNIQNYYVPELSGPIEETANTFVLEQDLVNYAGNTISAGTRVRGNIEDFGGGPVLLDESWYRTGIGGGFGISEGGFSPT